MPLPIMRECTNAWRLCNIGSQARGEANESSTILNIGNNVKFSLRTTLARRLFAIRCVDVRVTFHDVKFIQRSDTVLVRSRKRPEKRFVWRTASQ
jgi:hypothetical protein